MFVRALWLIVLSCACGFAQEAVSVPNFAQHDARLWVPDGFRGGPGAALAVEIGHGMESARHDSRRLALAEGVPVLALTPEGTHWSAYGTDKAKHADHTGFIVAAARQVGARLGVPAGRWLLLGGSSGGDLSYTLALRHPELFSACLPLVPGSLWERDESSADRIAVVIVAGETDWRLKAAEGCRQRLAARGAPAYLRVVPGMGHRQPTDAELLPPLRAALALLAPRRAHAVVAAAATALDGPDPELARFLLCALPAAQRPPVPDDRDGLTRLVRELEERLVTLDDASAKRLAKARAAVAEREFKAAHRLLSGILDDRRATLGAQHQAEQVLAELRAAVEAALDAALLLEGRDRRKALRDLGRELRRLDGYDDLRERIDAAG